MAIKYAAPASRFHSLAVGAHSKKKQNEDSMLKFFRRIRQRSLEESNLKKYLIYAIGEILLVIIGILIALQINNLNEEFKEKRTLISDLKNAQRYIQREIEIEEILRQNLIAWSDTIQHSLRIIEEIDSLSLAEKDYLNSANIHFLKVGLRTGEINTLQYLSASISKTHRESRHELVKALSQLMIEIQTGEYLENSFFDDLLSINRSIDRAIWRVNSKGDLIYDFELMKTNYDLQHLFRSSITYKNLSSSFSTRIIEKYRVVDIQIGKLLDELE